MLIDTHSHIYSDEFRGETDDVIKRALDNNVRKILLPNIDSSSIKAMLDLSDNYSNICYPMIGIHPTSVKEDFEEELKVFEYWIEKRDFAGVGEIGIDLYWDKTFLEEQEYVFRRQLVRAREFNLPLSIHVRESFEVVMKNLMLEYRPGIKGIFHCFSGDINQARQVLDLGFKIGVGGTVTYKNSGVDKLVAQLKPEDIVLETDSPYLSPTPYRGKRNESSYIIEVLKKVSEIYSLSEAEIAGITSESAMSIFEKLKTPVII